MKKFKVITLAVSAVLLLSACGGKNVTNEKIGIIEDDNVTAPGELPIVKEKIVLECAIESSTTVQDYNTNEFTKWVEEQTGIDIKFNVMTDMREKLKVMLAANSELPDILMGGGIDSNMCVKYGVNGTQAILDLGQYMDNYSYWMNDIYTKSIIPDIEKQMVAADGIRYFMPAIIEQEGNQYGLKTWINKTWLDKLGLKMPTTTEEFREVLKAFKTMDPNGNGKADELGMTGNARGWCAQPYRFLVNSFIPEGEPSSTGYANVGENGKLYINFTRDEYKDAIKYIAGLAKEGFFDKETFTRDGETMRAIAQQEDNIIGCFTGGSPDGVFNANKERMLEYVALPPLEGPDGAAYAYITPLSVGMGGLITKDCEHPLAAFRLLDFLMSEEATIRSRYGVEGKDWVYAGEGDIGLFESIGIKPTIKSSLQYGSLQNSIWEGRNPEFRHVNIASGMAWNGDPLDGEKFKAEGLTAYYKKGPEKYITKLSNTEEEYEELTMLKTDIITYAEEMIHGFMACTKDVDAEWDTFQKNLNDMGIDRYLELLQAGYDRYENGQ